MTFFVMNLACFFLKVGSAPNFRPGFKFFNWQTAFLGSLSSAGAMFFIDETYASLAICILIALFLLIHYLCPPKTWGDVSQNLIYHQVRKYLLRLKPEHIKFWRPHIILLINNPRNQTRLIQFCNSLKKGSLYILGHVIVTDDFNAGVDEAKLQQQAWTNYISEFSRIKAFVQLTMSPSLTWGVRNLILAAGLGGMRPNIAVIGFYNMNELRKSRPRMSVPDIPTSVVAQMKRPVKSDAKRPAQRRRGDTSARLLEGRLPTDIIRTESMMMPTEYLTILEDLALRYKLNVAVGHGFEALETPRKDGHNSKKYVDLWPIQMSAEVTSDGKNVLTTNFDTCKFDICHGRDHTYSHFADTLILQLGHILQTVQTWRRAYKVRVMVFVEYENEVEDESARVKALLEKLRIEATVVVFWLASGQLNSYELIVHGQSNDIDWEIIVNETLRDEDWWDDLQTFRGRYDQLSSSQVGQRLEQIFDSTSGRPGVYNPHEESIPDRRRSVHGNIAEIHRPTITSLSKLGVNIGMHTQHLNDEVLNEPDFDGNSEANAESSGESSDSNDDEDLPDEAYRDFMDVVNRPLLSRRTQRRRSAHSSSASQASTPKPHDSREPKSISVANPMPTYGTMSTSQTLMDQAQQHSGPSAMNDVPKLVEYGSSFQDRTSFPSTQGLRARSTSPLKTKDPRPPQELSTPLVRPNMSRQSSSARFSSRPVPEATITMEGGTSKLGFSNSSSRPDSPRAERPAASRQSSYGYGRFSSRPMPESRLTDGGDGQRTITFADQPKYQPQSPAHSRQHSRHHSRQHSRQNSSLGQDDVSLNIPELLSSYKIGASADSVNETGSSYSTQGIALSFNELPSRAQHLILNELMRRHSSDTAVLLSTLPIPAEGTSLDEGASIRYLSDIEVLCNELPPTLLVLSNNMTVTVSL